MRSDATTGAAARRRPQPTTGATSARAISDGFDQRETLALLVLPFLLLATLLVVSISLRNPMRIEALLRPQTPIVAPPSARPSIREAAGPVAVPREISLAEPAMRLPAAPPVIEVPQLALAEPAMRLPAAPPVIEIPQLALAEPAMRLPAAPPVIEVPQLALAEPAMRLPAAPPGIEVPQLALAEPAMRLPAAPPVIEVPQLALAEPAMRLPAVPPVIEVPQPALAEPAMRLSRLPPRVPAPPAAEQTCAAAPDFSLRPRQVAAAVPMLASTTGARLADFGDRLAAAARAQTGEFVIYNDKYRRISFPMGDVSPLFGVCTDVIIRAYRAVGVDLQVLVQRSRIGSGDASIDHRRTETLRRFFARFGQSLTVTAFPEDYLPGDIVTYHRPQNRGSRSHIAIVADVTGPSGRPMIVHNRGWGPQIEDALFVDRITGHYRFTGGPAAPPAVREAKARTPAAVPAPRRPLVKTALSQSAAKTVLPATP